MRVLISGAGPAGLTLAKCLLRRGMTPVIVEKAPHPRDAGYAVGVHVNGWNVAERLGLINELKANALSLGRSEYRDRRNRRLFSYEYGPLAAASGGKMLAIMRDALVKVLLDSIGGDVDVRYGTTVTSLSEEPEGIDVGFSNGETERFDLVVAADGYRSGVRRLWFGPHKDFLRPLGYKAAAWRLPVRCRMESNFTGFMDVDLQAGLYSVGDGTTATLFCWRDEAMSRVAAADRQPVLAGFFGDWPELIAGTFRSDIDWDQGFFDTICQVEAPCWSRGRVALLGDAAHCMTFLSGQSTSTAMAGAYILAGELAANPLEIALRNYEVRLKPLTITLQQQSKKIGGHYVPHSRLGILLQSCLIPLIMRPPFARFVAKRMLASAIPLD